MQRLCRVGLVILCSASAFAGTGESKASEPQLAHMVFFTLKEDTAAAKQKLVAACKKYLSGHTGTVYFSSGVIAQDLQRDVNDRDFHVSLHLVFRDKAAHDALFW